MGLSKVWASFIEISNIVVMKTPCKFEKCLKLSAPQKRFEKRFEMLRTKRFEKRFEFKMPDAPVQETHQSGEFSWRLWPGGAKGSLLGLRSKPAG